MAYGKKSYRKSSRTRKYASKSRKGLTKTEKTQVKSITKRAMNTMIESKYFDTATRANISLNSAWMNATGVNSEIAAVGFTTGRNRAKVPGFFETYTYGVNPTSGANSDMVSLDLNKVYTEIETTLQLRSMKLDGVTCRPAFCETKWMLSRLAQDTGTVYDNGLPYRVRMLRVRPRSLKGSNTGCDPKLDLFLNESNVEFGIKSVTASGSQVMDEFQFHLAKANSRKYQIIEDKFITMNPQMSYYNAGAAEEFEVPYATAGAGYNNRILTCKHNIGSELFYPFNGQDPVTDNSISYPSDGFIPEFILFHVCATGSPSANTSERPLPTGLRIDCRPVSTFKDA